LDDRQRIASIGEEPTEANEYQAIDAAEAPADQCPAAGGAKEAPQHLSIGVQF
jgi:hypothetical protein